MCTNDRRCSPLTCLYALREAKYSMKLTGSQSTAFYLLWKGIWGTSMEYLLVFLGTDVLHAKEKLYRLDFYQLPWTNLTGRSRWKISTMCLWHSCKDVSLISPNQPELEVRPGKTIPHHPQYPDQQQHFCSLVKVRSSDITSFSISGLLAVFLTGVLSCYSISRFPGLYPRYDVARPPPSPIAPCREIKAFCSFCEMF